MYAQTIAQFRKMLVNLDAILTKAETYAETKKFDVNVLATARLAPDMMPMTKQIQSCCDAAKFSAAYLTGKTPPSHEDNETTWPELHERLKKVINYLEGFREEDFKNAATIKVSPKWAKGAWLPGEEYLAEVGVPNFYFHVNIAYAILREAGVDIGKMDYLGKVDMRN